MIFMYGMSFAHYRIKRNLTKSKRMTSLSISASQNKNYLKAKF